MFEVMEISFETKLQALNNLNQMDPHIFIALPSRG